MESKAAANKTATCYGQTAGRTWVQESYETVTCDAARRTRQLRKAGFRSFSSAMGIQVTPVGLVKMTLVSIVMGAEQTRLELPTTDWKLERFV